MQPIDKALTAKIHSLVTLGVTSVGEMRKHLEDYVQSVIFKDQPKPSLNNSRWYPRNTDISNHIQLALRSLL